jgi:hypothetical protein
MLFKFGTQVGENFAPYRYDNIFSLEPISGRPRLRIGANDRQCDLLLELSELLLGPFFILIVLHTPRCGEPGRYQSPSVRREDVAAFMSEFAGYFETDARQDLWIYSQEEQGLLVYERHDLIYGYGPIEEFRNSLLSRSFVERKVEIPAPHSHNYNADFDDAEKRLRAYFDWTKSPLRPEDEQ